IKAAYAAAAARRGTLQLLAKTYLVCVNGTLAPLSNSTIRGMGQRRTTIHWVGAGFWLDNQTPGIFTTFVLQGLTLQTYAGNHGVRLGNVGLDFSEQIQRIDFVFRDLLLLAPEPVVANTTGMQLANMIRTTIEDCLFFNWDVGLELRGFDVGFVKHCRVQ